jgi:hypothetical protein
MCHIIKLDFSSWHVSFSFLVSVLQLDNVIYLYRIQEALKNNIKNGHVTTKLNLLPPTLIPLSGVSTTCYYSSCCDKDSAIIFTTGRLPDVNPP